MKQLTLKVAGCFIYLQLTLLPLALTAQFDSLPNFRYYDKSGINIFETPKQPVANYKGFKFRLGVGFAQSFQALSHSNSGEGKDTNCLYNLRTGVNTAMANLTIDVQLAPGMRFNLASYLSSRYHNETRLKAAYLQIDKLPIDNECWDRLMKVMTFKLGQMEINYGDAHFRRSDGGHTLYNPFMENYILDAFTTDIAAEVYARKKSFFAMAGISNSITKGDGKQIVAASSDGNARNAPAIYLKAGIDKLVEEWLRVRLSGSFYHNGSSDGNTLFNGDRAGSNYFMVMEKAGPGVTYANNAFSGRLNPEFTNKVDAFQINGFIKFLLLELFATYESASGRTAGEKSLRHVNQFAIDWVFRFANNENIFIASRYNIVNAGLRGIEKKVKADRATIALGYFFSANIMLKCELVGQLYTDFPEEDYRNNGKFEGCMVQAVIGF